ncbi:hypothetical protein VNO78_12271 [Psophocarpus tetragonolobus]|uniref:Uncharacterized protein n=1 Tax=Psophocarpus tetragonolobus TaxID=3891 RepID=A0AAN9SN28_PSOTE
MWNNLQVVSNSALCSYATSENDVAFPLLETSEENLPHKHPAPSLLISFPVMPEQDDALAAKRCFEKVRLGKCSYLSITNFPHGDNKTTHGIEFQDNTCLLLLDLVSELTLHSRGDRRRTKGMDCAFIQWVRYNSGRIQRCMELSLVECAFGIFT